MNWSALAQTLRPFAPAAAAALTATGPAGAAVGAAVARALRVPPDPSAVEAAIASDPDALVKLREIEAELRQAELASIADARGQTMGHWLTPVLTLVVVGMVVALGVALFLFEPPPANRDMVNTLLGIVLGWGGASIAYWLGSSRGSAEKADTIARSIR